jgi:trigger factor
MNISKRQTGDLNAIITIEIKPEDYQSKVDETIKSLRKNANIPGFRPGQVPAGIIRKKYGKEVLVEELNKLLGRELVHYISENKIDVLGSPIPVQSFDDFVLEDGKDFKFDYEIGIAPQINVNLPEAKIPYYLIKVDDKMVEDDINDMRRRYGKFSNPESAEETSVLYGEFQQLDENGEILENGNKTTTTLSIEMIRDEEEKKKFIGVKKDEVIRFNPYKALKNQTEVSAMLRLEKNSPALESEYQYTVKTVNKIEKAELNQELFDKVFGEGIVSNEEEFRAKIREGIASYFEKESDKKLSKDLRIKILEENNIPLPDDFLKRMLKSKQENKMDEHEFDHEYFHLAEDLKYNLIQTKIASEQSISVTEDDLKNVASIMIAQQFAQYGVAAPEDEKMDELVQNYLQKDDNQEKLERTLIGQKVFDYLKKNLKLNMIELPYEEFLEKLKEKTQHEVEHHHS